jgi:hypothetical protein
VTAFVFFRPPSVKQRSSRSGSSTRNIAGA